jgi:hypothetical protein
MNKDLSKLDLSELLGRLSPVPEPSAISLWPQTEAWGWVCLIALVLAAWLIRRVLLHRRANAYRRVAFREIAAAGASLTTIAEILRRTALAAFPRSEVAGLYGEEWLAFLDRTSRGTVFREGVGRAFARLPYAEMDEASVEAKQLTGLAVRWVRQHRRDLGDGGAS